MRSPTSNRGFTVIELLVVLLVIAVLIAVAAPSFATQSVKAQDSAAKQALTVAYRVAAAEAASRGGMMPSRSELVDAIRRDAPGLGEVRVAADHGEWSHLPPGVILVHQSGWDGAIGNPGSFGPDDAASVQLMTTSDSGNTCRLSYDPRARVDNTPIWLPCPYTTRAQTSG